MRKIKIFVLTLLLCLIATRADALGIVNAKVVRLDDADTLVVDAGVIANVRVACVDAPEVPHTKQQSQSTDPIVLNQYQWGKAAQDRITQLFANKGSNVQLNVIGSDRYGRNVAQVMPTDSTDLALKLVGEGLAVVYVDYAANCQNKNELLTAQRQAQEQKLGIWNEAALIMMPSEFRQKYTK
jgi:micrococcal nuclease